MTKRIILVSVGIIALWALLFTVDVFPVLRGGWGWRWPYMWPAQPMRLLLLVGALTLYIGVGWWLLNQGHIRGQVVWSVVGTVFLTLAVVAVRNPQPVLYLLRGTLSPGFTGWHRAATELTPEALLMWPSTMQAAKAYSAHVALAPPGLAIVYDAIATLAEPLPPTLSDPLRQYQCHDLPVYAYTNGEFLSALFGVLMPLWAGLTTLPLYDLARRLLDVDAARYTAFLWPLTPSIMIFTPYPTVLFTLLTVLMVWLLMRGLLGQQVGWLVGAGVTASALTFMTFSAAPVLLLAGLLALEVAFQQKHTFWWACVQGVWFGLGLLTVWGVFAVFTGFTPWGLLQTSMGIHLDLDRPYLPWLVLHLYDFAIFMGLPLVMLAAAAMWQQRRQPITLLTVLLGAGWLTVLILNVSGVGRAETGRVWLLFWPPILVGAAALFARLPTASRAVITGAQALVVLALVAVLPLTEVSDIKPPPPPPTASPGVPLTPVEARFGDSIMLHGFGGQAEGQTAELWLAWQTEARPETPYFISLLPVAPDGTVGEATVTQPFDFTYPMTCWSPADGVIYDRVMVPLPEAQPGGWYVSLRVLDAETGQSLPVILPDGTTDEQIGLGPLP